MSKEKCIVCGKEAHPLWNGKCHYCKKYVKCDNCGEYLFHEFGIATINKKGCQIGFSCYDCFRVLERLKKDVL